MHTPSLHRRVAIYGSIVTLLALIAFGVFEYIALADRLESNLDETLEARLAVATDLAREVDNPENLAIRLASAGIRATVIDPDGEEHHASPALPRFGVAGPAGPPTTEREPIVSRSAALVDGTSITVHATRAGVETTLRTLLIVLAIGTVLTVAAVALSLRWVANTALHPLNFVVAAAERTAAGRLGERLEPDDPSTELGRMATAYDRMLDSLESALADARESEELTRRFVADAAHQLRTPLAGTRGAIEMLTRTDDLEERDRMLAHAIRETSRATRLIEDLLRLANLERHPIEAAPTDLAVLCQVEVERLSSVAPELSITLQGVDQEMWADVDAVAVSEAVANLLDNARRHAEGEVSVTLLRLTRPDGDHIEIRVNDDGPGLGEGLEERAFERFATSGNHRGSGLGLSITRAVARAHGGEATYEDGSFVVRLPTSHVGEAQQEHV